MQVLLIRHAESENNELIARGSLEHYFRDRIPDPALTERGRQQAELLGAYLGKGTIAIDDLYCSPMLRTLQTVRPIAEALDIRPRLWLEIHEDGGMYTGDPRSPEGTTNVPGLTRAELARDHPLVDLVDAVTDEGWSTVGFETRAGCDARALVVAADLLARAEREAADDVQSTVALVSHGQFCDSLIKAFFGRLPDRRTFYFLHNTALSLLELRPQGRLMLRYLNRVDHLPADLLSE